MRLIKDPTTKTGPKGGRRAVGPGQTSKLSRLSSPDLLLHLETTLGRLGELSRGLHRTDIETGWVLSEMETNTVALLETIQILRDRH